MIDKASRGHLDRGPSWWRRDLLAGCRSGEFLEVPPLAERLRDLATWGCVGLMLLALFFWIEHGIGSELARINLLSESDPQAAGEAAVRLINLVSLAVFALIVGLMFFVIRQLLRTRREEQWPLSGAIVWRRTEIIRGRCLQWRLATFSVLALLVFGFAMTGLVRIYTAPWNTNDVERIGKLDSDSAHDLNQNSRK